MTRTIRALFWKAWPAWAPCWSSVSVPGASLFRWPRRESRYTGSTPPRRLVKRLRAKPGGASISVSIGDFANVVVEKRFSLDYVVFNTFIALPSQEAQVRCFANVAKRLDEGGWHVRPYSVRA